MVGVGITPEGINQNYVMYEFALDRAWYPNVTDVPKWIAAYTSNRYGIEDNNLQNAWEILRVSFILLILFCYFVVAYNNEYSA